MCAEAHMINFSFYSNGRVFDLMDKTDPTALLLITDYSCLDREIIIDKTTRSAKLGGQQQHTEINSVADLRTTFKQLMPTVLKILTTKDNGILILGSTSVCGDEIEIHRFLERAPFDFGISDIEKNLLVEQLVFDILFDKYLSESIDQSALMTRNEYARHMADKFCPNGSNKVDYAHSVNELLTRAMGTYYDRMVYSNLQKQLEMLGVVPDRYVKYYTPRMKANSNSKKPQFIWDQLWYNFALPLTARQYRRQFTREGRNYPYQRIFEDLKSYNNFVKKLLPAEYASCEKYFRMSMDYYVLEAYKRIDFMFRIIDFLPQAKIDEIDKEHFLVKRFHPLVSVPYEENDTLCLATKYKYYRPLFIMEDELLKEIHRDDIRDYGKYGIKLQKYQLIRAKAYELFKYHYVFISTNYKEMKNFLRQNQDMRTYHQSNDFWQLIQNTEWKNIDKEKQAQIKMLLQNLISLNNAFFWKSPDREYTKPKDK